MAAPPQISLLTAQSCVGHVHLVLGANAVSASRTGQSVAVGARPILMAPQAAGELHAGITAQLEAGTLTHLRRDFATSDLFELGRPEVDGVVDAVFISSAKHPAARSVSELCKRNRIPVNVVDAPDLCSFSLLSMHTDGPLQIGITTNGSGCKLASRIRREVVASLPAGMGEACKRLGDFRRRVQEEDLAVRGTGKDGDVDNDNNENDDSGDQKATFNKLVHEADVDATKTRRMRWLSQVCEYWPLKKLCHLSDAEVDAVLRSYPGTHANGEQPSGAGSVVGCVVLAGCGPGHPDLVTRATLKAMQTADLVLADKLVPAGVLGLVPRRTPVMTARKFPGHADQAQDELLAAALEGARAGRTVLRLKQGDPFVYGRGGEEAAFLRAQDPAVRVTVLPGLTSALAAPLLAGVPATQRDVADQLLVCTGTGRKGVAPTPPEFVATRTVVFLMALHRIEGLIRELTTAAWPADTPCAVIERASCPDQRIIRTTLRFVAEAVEQEGSRPPGLLVVGKVCEVLYTPEHGRPWLVEDGFKGFDGDDLESDVLAQNGHSRT